MEVDLEMKIDILVQLLALSPLSSLFSLHFFAFIFRTPTTCTLGQLHQNKFISYIIEVY